MTHRVYQNVCASVAATSDWMHEAENALDLFSPLQVNHIVFRVLQIFAFAFVAVYKRHQIRSVISLQTMASFSCMNAPSTLSSRLSGRKAFSGTAVPSNGRISQTRRQAQSVVPQALFTKNKQKNNVSGDPMRIDTVKDLICNFS